MHWTAKIWMKQMKGALFGDAAPPRVVRHFVAQTRNIYFGVTFRERREVCTAA